MKVKEFFAVTQGSRQLCFSEEEKPLCGRDFWGRYRMAPEWDAEIDHVRMIAKRVETDGMPYDGVVCIIRLKEGTGKRYHITVTDRVGRDYVIEKRFQSATERDAYLKEQEEEGYEILSVAESPEVAGCG